MLCVILTGQRDALRPGKALLQGVSVRAEHLNLGPSLVWAASPTLLRTRGSRGAEEAKNHSL